MKAHFVSEVIVGEHILSVMLLVLGQSARDEL